LINQLIFIISVASLTLLNKDEAGLVAQCVG